MKIFNTRVGTVLIIALISILLYGNTMLNKWAMDDVFVLKDNSQVCGGLSSIPEIFSTPYFSNDHSSFGYRPLTKAIYALEYEIFGINLPVHHAINVLLYVLCGILVFRFLRRYFESLTGKIFVWVIFLLWFLHPLHTEVVASLKNREELLCAIFALFSIEYLEKFVSAKKWFFLLIGLLFFIISFLAKQTALSVVILVPFLLLYRFPLKFVEVRMFSNLFVRQIIVVLIVAIVGYLLYRMPGWLFEKDKLEMMAFENPIRYSSVLSTKLSVSAMAMVTYFRLLVLPHPLGFYYGLYTIPELPVFSFPVIASVVLHILLVILTIIGLKKKKIWAFGSAFYLLSIFLFSNLPMEINGIVGERFLFLPSLGFAIAAASWIFHLTGNALNTEKVDRLSSNIKIILVVFFVLYTGKTIVRNTSWKDSLTLFKNDIRYAPKSVQAHNILAGELTDNMVAGLSKGKSVASYEPDIRLIIHHFRKSWLLFPKSYRTMNNLGDLYLNFKSNPDSALLFLAGAYRLKPDNFYVRYNIARCYDFKNDLTKAEFWYLSAIDANPDIPQAHQNLKNVQARRGLE